MKPVTYISNIEVPYRADFFSRLARECRLQVVYERRKSSSRDARWAASGSRAYDSRYLRGIRYGAEHSFSFGILPAIRSKEWLPVFGCVNSPTQILGMMWLRLLRRPYLVNLDGEQFFSSGLKDKIKRFIIRGASAYLVAGRKAAESLKRAISPSSSVFFYPFSSLSRAEAQVNAASTAEREDFVLVVGQYVAEKGLDVALGAARMLPDTRFVFVGMGARQQLFLDEYGSIPENVTLIPFLKKPELNDLYRRCRLFVLPSRQECWGLVINEAASFGTPIVSTRGSGAAVEFLDDDYPQYLATPGDAADLAAKIRECLAADNTGYSDFLKHKALDYTIEATVDAHLEAFSKLAD